ncbi:MAG: RDD family protein [Phycisphaerae bacterium]|jgi:uncharacterized RDD family membrane protein YckC
MSGYADGRLVCARHAGGRTLNATTGQKRGAAGAIRLLGIAVVALAAGLAAPRAAAQPTSQPTTQPTRAAHVVATEGRLWMACVEGEQTSFTYTEPASTPKAIDSLSARAALLASAGKDLYAFMEDGSLYCYADTWQRGIDLPESRRLDHAVVVSRILYGIVPSAVAAGLSPRDAAQSQPTSQPFEPGRAPLSVVRCDNRGWSAVVPCPVIVPANTPTPVAPRLCYANGKIMLFWLAQPPQQISYFTYEPTSRSWTPGVTIGVPGLTAFWVAEVNRTLTLVAAVSHPGKPDQLVVYRLTGSMGGVDDWRPVDVALSPLPEGVGDVRHVDAVGFNQHLGVLASTADGTACLQWGRLDGTPAMETTDVFAIPEAMQQPVTIYQGVRAAVLLAILVCLLAFRRGSIVTAAKLPPDLAIAPVLQRLFGCAIELVPASLLAAMILGVGWFDALGQMLRWAFEPQLNDTGLPDMPYLQWWALTAGIYVVYSFVMELAVGRTLGKMLMRLELRDESGAAPAVWQVVVRNVVRLVEVAPPFWLLGFFILLTRNRQRVGDILARTVAVQHISPPAGPDEDKPAE